MSQTGLYMWGNGTSLISGASKEIFWLHPAVGAEFDPCGEHSHFVLDDPFWKLTLMVIVFQSP